MQFHADDIKRAERKQSSNPRKILKFDDDESQKDNDEKLQEKHSVPLKTISERTDNHQNPMNGNKEVCHV